MDILEGIFSRRSVRDFTGEPVSRDAAMEIMRAGIWAPSGLNNQPWRFVPVEDREKRIELAGFTKYRRIVESAPLVITVFIDRNAMYNEVKDHQAIGACLQNMLLAAHALGLGAVWLGEILNRSADVCNSLGVSESMELMAAIAVGYPAHGEQSSHRRELEDLLIGTFWADR